MIALLAGSGAPRELTLVAGAIAAIAEAASRPDAPSGSRAGAWGDGVAELTRRAIELSRDRLEMCRVGDPDLEELFGLVLEVGRKTERDLELANAIAVALDEFDAQRAADERRRGLH